MDLGFYPWAWYWKYRSSLDLASYHWWRWKYRLNHSSLDLGLSFDHCLDLGFNHCLDLGFNNWNWKSRDLGFNPCFMDLAPRMDWIYPCTRSIMGPCFLDLAPRMDRVHP